MLVAGKFYAGLHLDIQHPVPTPIWYDGASFRLTIRSPILPGSWERLLISELSIYVWGNVKMEHPCFILVRCTCRQTRSNFPTHKK